MIEVYKYLNGLSLDIINTIFKIRQNVYNLRNLHIFESQKPKTKKTGLDSIASKARHLWKNVPEEVRNSIYFPVFKESMKKTTLISCLCNCCKKYIDYLRDI